MDNPQESSTAEPTNQPPMPPNSGIEWGAMALGFVVGIVWWFSQQAMTQLFFDYLNSNNSGIPIFSRPWFTWAWMTCSLISSFAYGLTIGFVVGYRARHQHYRFAVITTVLVFLATLFYSIFNYWQFFSPSDFFLVAVSLILNLGGALNGVYLALSIKRNRGVRIQ